MTGPRADVTGTRGDEAGAGPISSARPTLLAPLLAAAIERLRAAGVASPRADAEQLAAQVLGERRSRLVLVDGIAAAADREFDRLVERRAQRVPLQHLTGVAGFRYLDLAVGPGVFVPRPETESVVEWALAALPPGPGPVCVDLCAGSGAIALSIAQERPGAVVHAVEVEPAALVWLRRNVAATGLPVTVHEGDVTGALPALVDRLAGTVDLVISNPPYLPDADRDTVEPEVGRHDPARALWGGPDGLETVRAVLEAAARLLRPGGLLVVEHADGHGATLPAELAADGRWREIADHPDLAGRDRFVTAARAGGGTREKG